MQQQSPTAHSAHTNISTGLGQTSTHRIAYYCITLNWYINFTGAFNLDSRIWFCHLGSAWAGVLFLWLRFWWLCVPSMAQIIKYGCSGWRWSAPEVRPSRNIGISNRRPNTLGNCAWASSPCICKGCGSWNWRFWGRHTRTYVPKWICFEPNV